MAQDATQLTDEDIELWKQSLSNQEGIHGPEAIRKDYDTQQICILQNIPDNASVVDSAYISMAHSNKSTATVSDPIQSVSKSLKEPRKVPGTTNLLSFPHLLNEDTKRHWGRIRSIIEGLLIDKVRSAGFDPCTVSTRLLVVGETEEKATHRLVVYCKPAMRSSLQALFKSAHVGPILSFCQTNAPVLEPYIIPIEPKTHSRSSGIDVCYHDSFVNQQSYCGTRILLRHKSTDSQPERTQQAIFGGIIKVLGNGESRMYGMTAGHVVTELLAYQRSPNTETEQDQDIEGRICEYNIVGEILDQNLLPGVTAGQARPSHDWALFEVEIPRPNTVVSDSDQQDARHILSAARPSFTEGLSDPVVLLKNTGRTLRGELSDQSARIWLSQEEEFVDAYMLELDEGNGYQDIGSSDLEKGFFGRYNRCQQSLICNGDSGAWVVHNAAPEFYGHVVATDGFGDAYVIPALDTLSNIRDCMGAISVHLPDRTDFEAEDCNLTPTSETVHDTENDMGLRSLHSINLKNMEFAEHGRDHATCASPRGNNVEQPDHKSSKSEVPHSALHKMWDPEFSIRRFMGRYSIPYAEELKLLGAEGDVLSLLFKTYEGTQPSIKWDVVSEFCSESQVSPASVYGLGVRDTPTAWLDDRSYADGYARKYRRRLTVEQLIVALHQKRYGLPDLPDADRRLIYLKNLHPEQVLALAETVQGFDVDALKDALWKYLSGQTSFQVILPYRGLQRFRLEFHVSYAQLRKCYSKDGDRSKDRGKKSGCPSRDSFYLSLPDDSCGYSLKEVQVSFVIVGTDHTQWTAYAFVDGLVDPDDEEDEEEMSEDSFRVDQIAGDHLMIDANRPIWDPRAYFLTVMESRMGAVCKEWICLIQNLELALSEYRRTQSVWHSNQPTCEEFQNKNSRYEWVVRTLELIHRLRDLLSRTTRSCDHFAGLGDYFSNLGGSDRLAGEIHLDNLKARFEELHDLMKRLIRSRKAVMHWKVILETWFSFESHQISIGSHSLGPDTNIMNRESHRVNLATRRVTPPNQEAAQFSSLTAALALSTNQLMTPVAVVVAYFGTQTPIFHFERNLKTFGICVVVLVLTLKLYTFIIVLVRRLGWQERMITWFMAK